MQYDRTPIEKTNAKILGYIPIIGDLAIVLKDDGIVQPVVWIPFTNGVVGDEERTADKITHAPPNTLLIENMLYIFARYATAHDIRNMIAPDVDDQTKHPECGQCDTVFFPEIIGDGLSITAYVRKGVVLQNKINFGKDMFFVVDRLMEPTEGSGSFASLVPKAYCWLKTEDAAHNLVILLKRRLQKFEGRIDNLIANLKNPWLLPSHWLK